MWKPEGHLIPNFIRLQSDFEDEDFKDGIHNSNHVHVYVTMLETIILIMVTVWFLSQK